MKTRSKILSIGIVTVVVGFIAFWYQSKENLLATESNNTETVQLPEKSNNQSETPTTTTKNYKDGNYSVVTDYVSPAGKESLGVDVKIQDNKISSVTVKNMANNKVSSNYQDRFIAGVQSVIIGKEINSLKIGVVSGASLTANAFNTALSNIKSQALASN